jgi:hypothetical protein
MNLNDLWIVIPVGERETYLPELLKSLKDFKDRIAFINNVKGYTQYDGVHHIEDFGDINIYRWWNKGIDFAEKQGAKYVAILNDDLQFDKNFIPSIYQDLLKNKLVIVDTDKSDNGGGAAWIMDLSFNLRLNERFRWWYGDTELFDRAKKMDKFKKFIPTNFKHIHPNDNLNIRPDLQEICVNDAIEYNNIRSERGY